MTAVSGPGSGNSVSVAAHIFELVDGAKNRSVIHQAILDFISNSSRNRQEIFNSLATGGGQHSERLTNGIGDAIWGLQRIVH